MDEFTTENRSGLSWFAEAMQKSLTIQGRARRKEYWWYTLFTMIIGLGLVIVPLATIGVVSLYYMESTIQSTTYWFFVPAILLGFLFIGFEIVTMVPGFTVLIRRMHDNDMPGWIVLSELIPLGEFAILFFCLRNGTAGQNRYGQDPKRIKSQDTDLKDAMEPGDEPLAASTAVNEPIKPTGVFNLLSFLSPVYGLIMARLIRGESRKASSTLSKWSLAGLIVSVLITFGITGVLYADAKETDNLLSAKAVSILEGDEYYYEGVFYDGGDLDGDTLAMAVMGDDFVRLL